MTLLHVAIRAVCSAGTKGCRWSFQNPKNTLKIHCPGTYIIVVSD